MEEVGGGEDSGWTREYPPSSGVEEAKLMLGLVHVAQGMTVAKQRLMTLSFNFF